MEQVIERLRDSKKLAAVEQYDCGFSSGKLWAMSSASYLELVRIKKFKNIMAEWNAAPKSSSANYAEEFFFRVPDNDRSDYGEWWSYESVDGETSTKLKLEMGVTNIFVRGFVAGAIQIIEEVRKHI